MEIVWRESIRQALPSRFSSGHSAVPTLVIDTHGGLVLRSWQASHNPATANGHNVVPLL